MIEEVVVELLKSKKLKIATAESCTGGMVASRIVNVSGASNIFEQGFVTYSNSAKIQLVGVEEKTIDMYGAISKQTAKEMAVGCAMKAGADIGISVTGNAGPSADEGKEVGLVYIGCYYDGKTVVEECNFKGNRQQIRENAADFVFELIKKCVE